MHMYPIVWTNYYLESAQVDLLQNAVSPCGPYIKSGCEKLTIVKPRLHVIADSLAFGSNCVVGTTAAKKSRFFRIFDTLSDSPPEYINHLVGGTVEQNVLVVAHQHDQVRELIQRWNVVHKGLNAPNSYTLAKSTTRSSLIANDARSMGSLGYPAEVVVDFLYSIYSGNTRTWSPSDGK